MKRKNEEGSLTFERKVEWTTHIHVWTLRLDSWPRRFPSRLRVYLRLLEIYLNCFESFSVFSFFCRLKERPRRKSDVQRYNRALELRTDCAVKRRCLSDRWLFVECETFCFSEYFSVRSAKDSFSVFFFFFLTILSFFSLLSSVPIKM